MTNSPSSLSSRSMSVRLIAGSAAIVGCIVLGASAFMLAIGSRPSADPHGNALIFLPATLLGVLGLTFVLVSVGVWRQSRGWQLLAGIGLSLVVVLALVAIGVK
ncbi:MAG TPA: hypothetical protein VGO46_16390 [Gemmatimonadaceae bacterium]|jgi:hypothetical protein|nr:hypothetical protein [Gemmatimonadaceae bacterium]